MSEKIANLIDLVELKQRVSEQIRQYDHVINLCSGGACISSGSLKITELVIKELENFELTSRVKVNETGCMGICVKGPVMIIEPEGVFYCELKPEDVKRIVKKHFLEGKIVEELCYKDEESGKPVPFVKDIKFFKHQNKMLLSNCGRIDYRSIDDYIVNNGYFALAKIVTTDVQPEVVIEEIKRSGLRGRGGAGFPTGMKWSLARKASGSEKYVICNADEGDPGAFMDRSILEGDPHLVIEGMAIAAYAVGANQGFVYVRAEYPLAVERLQRAIQQSKDKGFLGQNILGTGFNFELEIRIGAGAFVCGEETALIASIEGQRGEPRQKPPFPADSGLFGKPTVINNVETYANIPSIMFRGADWYNSVGTEKSKGTKIFALAGDIINSGLIEVPIGITLGEVIYDIGGGIPRGKKFKAAQIGGPSGGCLTKQHLNTPIDYDSLVELGAIMGSGGLVCMDEETCMVDTARFFMEFVQDESCGKCVACRIGTKRMLEILERITRGEGTEDDLDKLIKLGETIKDTALCGLGQTAPNPILSTIKYFRHEYEEHIQHNYCRAGVCSELFLSPCENACPANVNVPGYIALIAAGKIDDAYKLIRQENPFPAVCGRVCTHPCETVCRRAQVDEPLAIADLKRYAADYVLGKDEPFTDLVFPKNGKSIGIIGSGPSGLTCGYYLSRLGYDVAVYEKSPVVGGLLATGIPEYRMPKEMLEKEINSMKQVGVNIITNVEIGEELSFQELKEKHDAIYIATGSQKPMNIGIENEQLPNIYPGLDFLRDVTLGKIKKIDGVVAVIGGGNTAVDASRVALRLGAQEVNILYRRTVDEMPADKREVHDAREEGVIIHPLVAPLRFIGEEKVEKIECIHREVKGFDSSGRRKTVDLENSNFIFNVDYVITAVSQTADLPFMVEGEVKVNEWGTLLVDRDTRMTGIPGVFAGGDVVRYSEQDTDISVVTAIADGKTAAREIDKYLGGKGQLNVGEVIEIPKPEDEIEVIEHERFKMQYRKAEERKKDFGEVALGFNKISAIAESMRCLRCDKREVDL